MILLNYWNNIPATIADHFSDSSYHFDILGNFLYDMYVVGALGLDVFQTDFNLFCVAFDVA